MKSVAAGKNVAFFLIPKQSVVWISTDSSVRHVFQQIEQSGYSAVPLLDRHGCYAGTITEGDLMRLLLSKPGLDADALDSMRAVDVPLKTHVEAVDIDSEIGQLLDRVVEQNFVPVKDSRGVFVGIVRRREILEHCAALLRGAQPVVEG